MTLSGYTEDDITTIFDLYDHDRDGVITFEEYLEMAK